MKKFSLLIDQTASQDFQDSIFWYNNQQPGLGRRFHAFIKSAFEALKINPFFKIHRGNIRCMTLVRFPFTIFYTVDENKRTITVYAVLHQAINPESINNRF